MIKTIFVCLLLACASAPPRAAAPFHVSIQPPEVDVEQLTPPAALLEPVETGTQFQTIPLNGGRYCEGKDGKSCFTLLPGFLVSEMVYAEAVRAKSDAGRLTIENQALRKLRAAERAAVAKGEAAYQVRVLSLEQENAALRTPSAWERARPYVGFVLGVALTSGVVYVARLGAP